MTSVALDIPPGRERWEFEHDRRRFLALRHDGSWVVVDAECPHRRGRLLEGVVRGDELVCPSHWYTFDLHTGACRTSPDHQLGVYAAHESDGRLVAEIPEHVERSWSELLRSHAVADTVPQGRTNPHTAAPGQA